jgi:hypothetical protein
MRPVRFSKNVIECQLAVDNNIGFPVRYFLRGYGHWLIRKIVKNGKDKRSRDSGEKYWIMQGRVGGLDLCVKIRVLSLLPYRTNCFSFNNSGRGFSEILQLSKNDHFPIRVRRVIWGSSDADPSSFINLKIMMSVFPLKEGNNCNDNRRGYCDIFEGLLQHEFGSDSTTLGVEDVVANCAKHGV